MDFYLMFSPPVNRVCGLDALDAFILETPTNQFARISRGNVIANFTI